MSFNPNNPSNEEKIFGGGSTRSTFEDRAVPVRGEGLTEAEDGQVGAITAKVGPLTFNDAFSDPDVTVDHTRNFSDHSVITGKSSKTPSDLDYIVQARGRSPARITITGWVTESQLDTVDSLVSESAIALITARWIGTAIPRKVETQYSRVWHDTNGWIFRTTIELISVMNGYLPKDSSATVSDLTDDNPEIGFATVETETLADEKEERREAIDDALESRGYDPDDEQSDDSDSELNIEYNPGDTFV